MKKIESYALLAFEQDIKSRTVSEWLWAHTSLMKPLHRYDGIILLELRRLVFRGVDIKTNEPYELIVGKDEVEQIYYGFDDTFSAFEVRGLGLLWKPLRLTIIKGGGEVFIYLVINFRAGFSDNKQWFEILKDWAG